MPQSLWNRGFIALLITQFTVAFNDNVFRWLLVPIGKEYVNEDIIRFLGAAFLIIPFILWASWAGFLTDRFSRRTTVIGCKMIELILLAVAVGVICLGPEVSAGVSAQPPGFPVKIVLLLGILFLLGSQAAVFSPSKYSLIPDLVPEKSISAANGIIAMFTMIAIVSGQIIGGYVFFWTTFFQDKVPSGIPGANNIWVTALVLVGVCGIGLLSSFFIPKMKAVDSSVKFPKNPLWQTGKDLAALFSYRTLFWVAIASAFFWGLAALAQNNIDKFAAEYLMVEQQHVTPLAAILTLGIGIGAVICGYLSGKRIELGIVPIGAFFMGLFILILGFTPGYSGTVARGFGLETSVTPYIFGAVFMLLAGLGAGLYDIPLAAYIQKNSPPAQRGRMIAAYNFCTFSAMFVFAGFGLLGAVIFGKLGWSPGGASLMIWIATGLLTLSIAATLCYAYAGQLMIFGIRCLTHILFRPKFVGVENVPAEGGALFVCNHISLIDGFSLYCASPRPVRFIAHQVMIPKILEPCGREAKVIKILPGNPKNVLKAVREAREALKNGEAVGIFPEGGITRNGQTKAFEPGFLSILKGITNPDGSPIPIIPCHIGGLHESMFGYKYSEGKIIFKPRKLISDVIFSFGKPMYDVKYPQQVQLAVQELGVDSYAAHNKKRQPIPIKQLIRACKKRGNRLMFADSTGVELNGYKFLTAALALRSILRNTILGSRSEEPHVGILAPMSVGGCILNAAFNLDRRVPVNLNFTFGVEGINYCIKHAGIKTVLTSRRVLERFPNLKLEMKAKAVCTEDLVEQVGFREKIKYFTAAKLLPSWLFDWRLGLAKRGINEELMTIIYTSGSTGQPKGVMLTHDNIAEVARGFVGTQRLGENDVLLGFLPFFHAFGLMGNFWLSVFAKAAGVFHFSPLEPKKVAEMARKYSATFMPATPTFLRNFLRACPKEDFEHVPAIVCGAEKLPVDLIDAWEKKYGVRPTEGYGTTELSPVMATNVPESRVSDTFHTYRKDGSIGRPICNIVVKVIDLETGADLPPNEIGMIVAKGPTVMKGYYKLPDKTAEVIKDGWYTTGDVGKIDEDGFIFITGRESRISKIGGEMVPHVLIEEEIQKIVSAEDSSESAEPSVAVTALPHPTRGEQIIVLYKDESLNPEWVIARMAAANLPRIWIPRVDGFIKVDSIPVLGTGKLDLAAVRQMASAHYS